MLDVFPTSGECFDESCERQFNPEVDAFSEPRRVIYLDKRQNRTHRWYWNGLLDTDLIFLLCPDCQWSWNYEEAWETIRAVGQARKQQIIDQIRDALDDVEIKEE